MRGTRRAGAEAVLADDAGRGWDQVTRVVVTGGGGFVGSHVVERFAR